MGKTKNIILNQEARAALDKAYCVGASHRFRISPRLSGECSRHNCFTPNITTAKHILKETTREILSKIGNDYVIRFSHVG